MASKEKDLPETVVQSIGHASSDLFTHNGYVVEEALRRLDDPLPERAYRELGGGKGKAAGLTDISPAYQLEMLSKYFGPVGIGWGYNELEYSFVDGYASMKLELWYKVYEFDGAKLQVAGTVNWTARGGNSNQGNKEWAEKGALTNAIGAGWSMQGFQASVYKGIRSHNAPGETAEPIRDASEFEERAEQRKQQIALYAKLTEHFTKLGVSKDDDAKRAYLKASGVAETFNNMKFEDLVKFEEYLSNEVQKVS